MVLWSRGVDRLTDVVGGPARRRVVLLLAGVLSLQAADAGTVGAVAPQLEEAFRIGNTRLGLLITVSSLVGALAALPMGAVADRRRRVHVLVVTIVLWSISMVATGLATTYMMVLGTRLALGIVTAAAGPIVASLVGDLFPAKERSRIYGMVLTGELLGAGVGLVLSADIAERDPLEMSSWAASTYVLRIPSNLVLIAASVLGYFFLAGLRSFAVLFVESHYQISQAAVTLVFIPVGAGAAVGTLFGGRLVDRLIRRGKIDARITVSAVAFIAAAVLFLPGLHSAALFVSVPLFALAAACLTAPNPALDAARLDVVPSRLWGRGEAVRTFSELVLEAFAPLIFGYVSMQFGGPGANLGPGVSGNGAAPVSAAQGRGLEDTFIIMLVPLLAAGLLLLLSRRHYLRDVATADVSDRALREVAIKSVAADYPR